MNLAKPDSRMKVIAARICHESHAFSVLPTTLTDFANQELLVGEQILVQRRGTRSEMGGIIDAAQRLGWDLVPVISCNTAPSGPVTRATYEALLEPILHAAASTDALRAVVISLHGSMYVEGLPDPEGDLLRRIKAVVGPDVVLAATLDLHANVTDAMVHHADLMTSYRTTPHIDQFETATRLCGLVDRALRGEIRPTMRVVRRAMIAGMDLGRTLAEGPMVQILREARALEQRVPGLLDIGVNAGYPYGDVRDMGPSVVVVGDGDDPAHAEAAERLMDMAEAMRDVTTVHLVPVSVAVALATQPASGPGPLLLAEYTDGPGGGGYGDATRLLAALLEARIPGTVVGALYDPVSARQAIGLGVGARATFEIGGRTDPRFGGEPVRVEATVMALSDGDYVRRGPFETGTRASLGPSARLDVDGVQILVASYRIQAEDREQYRIFGIDPDQSNVIALKGINHFRADMEPVARGIVFVEAGGIVASDLRMLPYRHVRRPVWPLDA
jgi:microcystin degradation protein MlrC